ncbi:tRNA-specific adenosine deaminase [Candidatus Rubidus massiliensis]|nr:tRNA-specific adenosine deaminase [Candidatus Rubidus massiliensis]
MHKPFPFATTVPQDEDEHFMLEALKQAWKAYQENEVPVGAVLVQNGQVIARGYNQVEKLIDATAHAEMLCLTSAESALNNWRLLETTLYITIEPCAMCAGAILLTRVSRLVWGAPDIRHGANGSWVDLFEKKHPTHQIEIKKGVLENYAAALLKEFFQKRRSEKRYG